MGGAWPCYHLAPDVVRLGVPDVLEAGAPLEVVLARFAEEDRGVVEGVPAVNTRREEEGGGGGGGQQEVGR
jgi:hypothetical protein